MTKQSSTDRGGIIPARKISISSDSHTRELTLSPLTQLLIGGGVALSIGWMALTTATTVVSFVSAGDGEGQAEIVQEAVDQRIAMMRAERDQFAADAKSARARFSQALEQISQQQSSLLELMQERNEMEIAVGLLREDLGSALSSRDELRADVASLSERLDMVSGKLNTRQSGEDDLEGTLVAITDELQSAVEARDMALSAYAEKDLKVAGLELKMQVNSERQERMLSQLEQAVEMSFSPLEDMFAKSGLSVDSLVGQVRRSYSGVGGPLLPVGASSGSYDDPEMNARYAALIEGMDKMNLMRIAAEKVPYTMPVLASHRFTSGFGTRRDPKTGGRRAHNGIDLAGPRGTPINSTADGVVIFAGRQSGFGNLIKVRHAFGFETLYAHLNKIHVKVGDRVSRNEHIGDMGTTGRSTGVHLHYEIRIGGKPVNPMTYIKAAKDVL